MARETVATVDPRLLRPFSGMTDGQLRRGEGFRRDNPEGLFIAESAKVIDRALDAGLQPLAVLAETHWLTHDGEIIHRLELLWPGVPIIEATAQEFAAITGYQVVRGALACFKRPEPLKPESILGKARRIAILEDVGNYTNMGTIFRSAAGLGIDGVLITPSGHDPYYRRCARVSMGAVFQVPWARLDGPADWAPTFIPVLKEAGFTTAALALREDAENLQTFNASTIDSLALVLGTEGEGLRPSTIAACDHCLTIPMAHGVDSLNVAACAAIAFFVLS